MALDVLVNISLDGLGDSAGDDLLLFGCADRLDSVDDWGHLGPLSLATISSSLHGASLSLPFISKNLIFY